MNQKFIRALVVLSLTTSSVMAAAPSSFAEGTLAKSNEGLDELLDLSSFNPFPSNDVAAIDPITKKKMDQVLVGPAYKSTNGRANFDYYRYVTFFDIESRKERIYALPIQHEECHDLSELFASYSYNYTFTSAVTASISLEGLGLSAAFTKSRAFTAGRNLRATGKITANHVPYFVKQDWSGQTYIQTYNSKTKKVAFIVKENPETTNWFVKYLFPALAQQQYPMPFEAKDAEWTFLIERTILSKCTDDK